MTRREPRAHSDALASRVQFHPSMNTFRTDEFAQIDEDTRTAQEMLDRYADTIDLGGFEEIDGEELLQEIE
jgi:hypothetical protein